MNRLYAHLSKIPMKIGIGTISLCAVILNLIYACLARHWIGLSLQRFCLAQQLPWKPRMWAGVTVESEKYLSMGDYLKKLPDDVNKFIMMEPLLSPMPKMDLNGIDWVVVGGETNSKRRYRPLKENGGTDISNQVEIAGFPFMFKHWPGKSHNSKPALLQGKI